MASLVKNKGKAGMPSFYSGASTTVKSKAEGVKSKLPLFALLILAGVAIIFVLRNRSSGSSTQTGAALTVIPTAEGDIGNILNMTAAINALNGQVHAGSSTPSGGSSSPITVIPNPPNTPSGNVAPLSGSITRDEEAAYASAISGYKITADQLQAQRKSWLNNTGINSIGPMSDPTGRTVSIGSEGELVFDPTGFGVTQGTNLSLVDWYKRLYSAGNDGSMYGPNAGPEQKALDAAASAEAKRQLGIK